MWAAAGGMLLAPITVAQTVRCRAVAGTHVKAFPVAEVDMAPDSIRVPDDSRSSRDPGDKQSTVTVEGQKIRFHILIIKEHAKTGDET